MTNTESLSGRMTVEMARKVLWLRSNRRPLGELLDEGYLTPERLAWAAAHAYDPQLKQAAAVLLEWLRSTQRSASPRSVKPVVADPPLVVQAGLTLEQARAVPWPFRTFKGQPMGPLVDAHQLDLRDLVYAIENAWDERVRRAAVVLLATRLNQTVQEPQPPAGPLKVVAAGRSYSQERELGWTFIQGWLSGWLFLALLVGFVYSILVSIRNLQSPLPKLPTSPVQIVALVIMLAIFWGLMRLVDSLLSKANQRLKREIEMARKGQEGEERLLEALRQSLDGNWMLFRNVVLPGRNQGDLDAVLVGPPGVWVLEVKMFNGEYRNTGEHWEYRAGQRWRLLKKSPSRQARDNAVRLASFFRADGLSQWVEPAVVWANDESPLIVNNPAVAVWPLVRLPEELGNLWQRPPIDEQIRGRIIEKLTTLCQQRPVETE